MPMLSVRAISLTPCPLLNWRDDLPLSPMHESHRTIRKLRKYAFLPTALISVDARKPIEAPHSRYPLPPSPAVHGPC